DNLPAVIDNPDWFASDTEMAGFRANKSRNKPLIELYKGTGRRHLLDVGVWHQPYRNPVEASADEVRIQIGMISAEDFPFADEGWDDVSNEEARRYLDSDVNNGPAQLIYERIEEASANHNGATLDTLDSAVEDACRIIAIKLKQLDRKVQPAEILSIAQGLETSYFSLIKKSGMKMGNGTLSRIGGVSRLAETIHVYYGRKD
ncbi:MAG: hypothetical protein WCT36_04920, partial [Candidatus Gracilibacteria bacterium]